MLYQNVIDIFEEIILPVVIRKYDMAGYIMKPLDSHEGGRNVIYMR